MDSFKGILSHLVLLALLLSLIGGAGCPHVLVSVQKELTLFQAQQTYSDVLIALNEDICHQLNNWNRQDRKTNPFCGSGLQTAI